MIAYVRRARRGEIAGTALVRLDFNTKDDWRMLAILPTLRFLTKTSRKIVIVSHRGRPTGFWDKKLSLRKDAEQLSRLLRRDILFIEHFDFAKIGRTIREAPSGSVFLLENLRFLPGEEKNDLKFAESLASLADFYVNDAFAVSHRANASVVAITKFLPSYAGFELEDEIRFLSHAMRKSKHPLVLMLGGAKAADKLGVITYFKKKADCFLLGGGPANTLLFVLGMNIKKSLKDDDLKDVAVIKKIARYKNIVLPEDFVWHNDAILDLGPKTIVAFNKKIANAKTIIWSGPLGMTDKKPYDLSSLLVAKAIVKNSQAFKVVGGGETVMFLRKNHLDKKFTFVSTGGGAMMDYLAGEKLPGIEALEKVKMKK